MSNCCHGCVPPKRAWDCHGRCPEYAAEVAANAEKYRIQMLRNQADATDVDRIKRGKKALQRARTGRAIG